MSLQGLHDGLTFIVTRRCPLQCEHCVMESGPWYHEHLTAEDMKAWLAGAREFGITRVSYSGGDPVLCIQDLSEAIAFAHDLGMKNSLFTSAFWAATVEQGKSLLGRLKGLDILGLSASSFHERFVPLSRIANAIVAAVELGLQAVEVQIADFEGPAADIEARIRAMLPPLAREIPMRRQSVFSAGRAAQTLTVPEQALVPTERIDMRCPAPALTVEPDGLLRGCCSALLALKEANPFILGDLRSERMQVVLDRATRLKHYQTVRTRGLAPIVSLLREDGLKESVPDRVVNSCDLCYRLYAQKDVAEHLSWRLANAHSEEEGAA